MGEPSHLSIFMRHNMLNSKIVYTLASHVRVSDLKGGEKCEPP